MALKDILVCVDRSEASLARLRLGVDLASRHDSRLTALYVREWSAAQLEERRTAELGLVTADQLDRLERWIEESIDQTAETLRSKLESLGRAHSVETEWRSVLGPASAIVPQHARYADLCIVGCNGAPMGGSVDYSFSEQLLFLTGRPLIFVPLATSLDSLGRHVAVAWNSSRPAARAVNDALRLIERSEHTTLLTVNPEAFIDRRGAPPVEWMIEHLRRHGASTSLVRIDGVPLGSIADALQARAIEIGADLLVAGAFGHPKLWEKLLGGVTRDLLDRMHLPIFMSH